MDLPDSITAIEAQLGGDGAITVDPQLLSGADVFAAERQRLFLRPWVAVDHQSRISEPGRYVRFEAASRSILLTRDHEGRLRALRNVCLHAGYPICEAEEGPADRLVCPYHGWEFAADGRLLEPDLSARIDPARLRLASHPVCIRDGLIFVDLSKPAAATDDIDDAPVASGTVPPWLGAAEVTARARYATEWNWKLALQFVKTAPYLFCENRGTDAPIGGDFIGFGPLSFMLSQPDQATLLRVIPKSAAHTDIQVIRMAPSGTPPADLDGIADQLRAAGETDTLAGKLDRAFFGWYWSLMTDD
ncbi:MAG TPA: Rieske (2Fe-2S) protein [Stellaceae bacterium]|nr:Rieske (2Fe-2S) protein [Stellaceae bacterium]